MSDTINLQVENDTYKELDKIISHDNFLKDMISKVQKISMFIRKIKIEEEDTYYEHLNNEAYKKLIRKSKKKIELLIQKTMLYVNSSKEINVQK